MKTKNLLRSLAGTGVAVLALTGLGAPAANAFPVGSCSDYADCGQVTGHISRGTVINRAMIWVNEHQFYSQAYADAYNGTGQNLQHKWRRDCSGFVSMAWRIKGTAENNYGRNTGTLPAIAPAIPYSSLLRGDILNDPDGGPGYSAHVVMFDGWVGAVGGDFFIIEENGDLGAVRRRASEASFLRNGGIDGRNGDAGDNFIPRRYQMITNS